ncbi:hypothetical protein ACIQVK_44725 [Streptomyces sp. NPDC090493]|uniref:hypothetical protein n=1 Tax=Streptomyces sp. NPDC090493 TaxID=3365964 RepID=UPI00381A320C
MRTKLRLLAWALVLLALAHPAFGSIVLDVLGIAFVMAAAAVIAVIGWALANVSLTLTGASVLLLLRAFPGVPRWFRHSWVASVAAVAPEKA